MSEINYKSAGVDLNTSDKIKASIRALTDQSCGEDNLHGIGLFSGFYPLNKDKYEKPVLVSSIDGIGTKVKIAERMQQFASLGEDLVNHCVNDIMVCGAEPLFILDYIAADKLHEKNVTEIISGIIRASQSAECTLIGGETAEMPGVYAKHNFDIAGAIVGIVERDRIIDGSRIQSGDALIGVASNGLHTNGYSLARKALFEQNKFDLNYVIPETKSQLGVELLKPHRLYQTLIRRVRESDAMHGIAHITGGGLIGNTTRLLRDDLRAVIDWNAWEAPAIFRFIQEAGQVPESEMQSVFNMGMGLILIVEKNAVDFILSECESVGEQAQKIGSIK